MGKSKDLASGNSAAYVETAGDTMSGALNVNGGNLSVNSTSEAANRYLYLNTGATNDGHILFQRAGSPKFQISSDTSNNLFTWNYAKNGTSFRINADGSTVMPHQPSFAAYVGSNHTGYDANSVGNSYVVYNTDLYDIGNNHSNGLFTAPVAGVYYFRAEAYTSTYCTQSWFIVNGSRTNAADSVYSGNDSFSGNSTILKLAANDTVGFHPYRSGYNSITVNANANHSWFRGMLIG